MRIKSLILFLLTLTAVQTRSQADLNLDVTVDDTLVDVGQTVTFTISVRNDGPETTLGVDVLARLPAGYEFVGAETTGEGSYDPVSGIWSAGGIGLGATDRLRLQARVVRTVDLHFLAEVVSSEAMDPDSLPNNGVDTDGDGNTVDDPDDEDDGDGQIIIAGGGSTGTGSGVFGECLAPLEAESAFTPNSESEINSFFRFDYKIEAVVKFQMADLEGFSPEYGQGDPMEFQMTYYVNSADGSILFPGGDTGFFKTNFNYLDDYGTIDAAIWLSNGQMVSYVNDDKAKKLRAITRESAQTATGRMGSDYLNMMQFFSSSFELATIPDPLPDYVQWPGATQGFRGELVEAYTGNTNVIDMYFDTAPTPIRTTCIMMGFMVGVLKDVRNTQCNRVVVYNKVHIGGLDSGDSMEAILKTVKPMGITFDGTPYEPFRIGGAPHTGAAADMMKYEDKMRVLEGRRMILMNERENCMSSRCREQINEALEALRLERARLVCEYSVEMGYHSSIADCMAEEE